MQVILKKKSTKKEISKIIKTSLYAKKNNLDVHAGHGLTYQSVKPIIKIKSISELNIGHFIVSESLFIGLKKTIKNFKRIINK